MGIKNKKKINFFYLGQHYVEGLSLRKAEKAVELKTLFSNFMVSKDTTILF